MKKQYAAAVERLIEGGANPRELAERLITTLEARGRVKLLPGIRAELLRRAKRRETLSPMVEVAHEKDAKKALAAAKAEGIVAKEVVHNKKLLSGWRARGNGVLIDRSAKRALTDLYARIVQG